MRKRDDILKSIEEFIEKLSQPLQHSEIKNGWSPELQEKWKQFYQRMYEYLESGKPLSKKPKYTASIVRQYDFSGIMEGELLDKAIYIQCRSRELKKKEEWWKF